MSELDKWLLEYQERTEKENHDYKIKIEIESKRTKRTYNYKSTERTREEMNIFIQEVITEIGKEEIALANFLEKHK